MTSRFLTPMAFDFLWEEQGLGEYPYPLSAPSHGATMDERVALRHRVMSELKAQGVKDAKGRLDPTLDGWLRVLAFSTASIDAVHVLEPDGTPNCVLAAGDGAEGVLAVQNGDGVWLRPIYPDALVSEVIALLPRAQRGTARSITLSLDEALHTEPARVKIPARQAASAERESAQDQRSRFGLGKQLLGIKASSPEQAERPRKPLAERTAGNPREDYALLAAQPRERGGQLAANARDAAGRKQRSPVLAWFDTVTGRYLSITRTGPDGQEWVTISGADLPTLRTRMAEMVAGVTAQSR